MAIATFGVTAAKVYAHHFPQLSQPSTSSKPTLATCTEMVEAAAAELGGKLRAEGLTPSTIDAATTSEGYAWCADTVRLGAAIRILPAIATADPDVAKAWQKRLDAKYAELEERGYLALGDATAPSQLSAGPRTHISAHGLDVGDSADISDVVPVFRRSDEL